MPSVNKCIIVGNLTRDPQTKQIGSGTVVTEFGLAMNRKWKTEGGEEREEVCFVDVAAFGRQGEVIQKYCTKGKLLYIEARLKYDSWEKDGQKRSKLSLVVENFQFLGGRDGGLAGDDTGEQRDYTPPARTAPGAHRHPARQPAPKPEQPFGDEVVFNESDVPW